MKKTLKEFIAHIRKNVDIMFDRKQVSCRYTLDLGGHYIDISVTSIEPDHLANPNLYLSEKAIKQIVQVINSYKADINLELRILDKALDELSEEVEKKGA